MTGRCKVVFALATSLVSPAAMAAWRGSARLGAEAGVQEIKSTESLPVSVILVPAGSPAMKGQRLVTLDTRALERDVEASREGLRNAQSARRWNSGNPSAGLAEAGAAQRLAGIQARLAATPVLAPSDGYVVRSLVDAGVKAKRRKPLLTFVDLSATRLTVMLDAEPSPPVGSGETVTVWSADGRSRFRARIDRIETPSDGASVLRLTPLDLPFLRLDFEQDVALQLGDADPQTMIATPADAQPGFDSPGSGDPGLSEKVDVEVVNVDVVVVDRRGNRVTDLSREEFELEVDGEPVAIEYFSAPSSSAIPEGEEPSRSETALPRPESPGRLLVFVDESALEGRISTELLQRIEVFLLDREKRGEEIFLAAYNDVLRPLHSGSDDPKPLAAALAELKEIGGRGNLRAREHARLESDVRANVPFMEEEIRQYEDEEILRQRRMVAVLRRWVSTFAGVEGRKMLLVATAGLNAEPGAYLYELLGVVGGASGPSAHALAATSTTGMRLLAEVDDLLRALHDARFVVYSATPPETPFLSNSAEFRSLGPGTARVAPRDRTDADAAQNLARLADETGGAKFLINAALDEKIESIGADAAASYSLGFSTGPEDGFDEHQIRVHVRRPGLEVRSRSAFRRIDPAELRENSLVSAASLDVVDSSFGLELMAGDPVAGAKKGGSRRYPVTVRIPIAALSLLPGAAAGTREARIEVRFAVSRTNGELKLGEATPVTITIPEADLEQARADFWAHRGEVEVGKGEARVGVLVTDLAAGGWSTASVSLSVH